MLPAFAAVMMLVPITADDARRDKRQTFVSDEAKIELANTSGDRVLCLDRDAREAFA